MGVGRSRLGPLNYEKNKALVHLIFESLSPMDSKRNFDRDFDFGSGTAKSLEYANRILYRGYRGMETRFAKLQNLSDAAVPSRFGHISNQ